MSIQQPKTLLIILILYISTTNSLYSSTSNVISLTESNFNEKVINSNELWLIEFYAPWCGHCKNLAPEWEKAANILKGIVKIGAVDADTYKSLGGKYGIKGFPTIKWFGTNKNNPKDYESGRTANDISSFALSKVQEIVKARMSGKTDSSKSGNNDKQKQGQNQQKSNSNPDSDKDVVVIDDNNFESVVMNSKDMWIIDFYAPWCGHCKKLEPEWNVAASELKGKIKLGKVDATQNSKLASQFRIEGYPTIKIFPPGEKNVKNIESYDGGRDSSSIIQSGLDRLQKYGYIPDINQIYNTQIYTQECIDSGKSCVLAFLPNIYESSAKERNSYIEVFKKTSTIGNGKPISFFWVQGGDNFDFEEKFGLQFGFPAVIVVNHNKKKYSIMRSAYDYDNIKTFLNRVLIGKEAFYDFPSVVPSFNKGSKWDGKDAVLEEKNEDL